MPPLLNPRLVNSPFGDPALFAPFFHEKRAFLFDIGDIAALAPRDILKITHCFVSHTHMDHFIGFDHLLRIMLGREKALYLYGPEGFHDNVAGKISGYTWNLVENYDSPVTLVVSELSSHGIDTRRYACNEGFRPVTVSYTPWEVPWSGPKSDPAPRVIFRENHFQVEAALLDHGTACLAYAVNEPFHVNIRREMLEAMDLEPGRWLFEFKRMILENYSGDTPVYAVIKSTGGQAEYTLGELTDRLVKIGRGRKIAYVTDAAATPGNVDRIAALAKNCDQLFIESMFLESERRLAEQKKHLTAFQAGRIAAEAGASRSTLFHFSPRYRGMEKAIYDEFLRGFWGLRSG